MDIKKRLADAKAVITGSHFVFTSGVHSDSYINMRAIAHDHEFWDYIGMRLSKEFAFWELDAIVGPETLGRTMAENTARHMGLPGMWCDVQDGNDGAKVASFNPKLDFGRLIKPGMRIGLTDDLLTTGGSVLAVSNLIKSYEAVPVITGVAVRRDKAVTKKQVGSTHLVSLLDLKGLKSWSQLMCQKEGPCSEKRPMQLRPGHGHTWIKDHEGYPTT